MSNNSPTWVPPGHFYSPIVDVGDVRKRRDHIFDRSVRPSGIDLRDEQQLTFMNAISKHCHHLPFTSEPQDGLRFHYENPAYSYGDAMILAGILMEFRPCRMLEIGSGYSSCVTLDVNDLFLGGTLDVTFVEPNPKLLLSLMKPGDHDRYNVVPVPVQDIDLSLVDKLEPGDVLFIDSTHVSKCGSDVNFEFFSILPRLKPGVYIHFHDIFYPFEYKEEWIFEENRSWNEIYILRAFLMNNHEYEIVFFNHFMHTCYREETITSLPLFALNPGGSLWLRKVGASKKPTEEAAQVQN